MVAQEILAQKLVIEFEDERRIMIGLDDIQSVTPPKGRTATRPESDDNIDWIPGDHDHRDH